MNVKQSVMDCFHALKGGCPISALKKLLILLAWITLSLGLYLAGLYIERDDTLDTLTQPQLADNHITFNEDDTNIRILIKTDGYEGIYHSEVIVEAEDGMDIDVDGSFFTAVRGTQYRFAKGMDYEKVVLTALDSGICIKNLERNSQAKYSGQLEMIFTDEGIVVINELPIEDYLCGVIPSEMPSTYPLEALKAQAVSARTYTYYHMKEYAYPEWEAHMDDSTMYQVYMNNTSDKNTDQAVAETKGMVLTYGGEVVESFYYSTSGGYNGALAVWNDTPSNSSGYLMETGDDVFASNTVEGENAYRSYIDEGDVDDVEYGEAWYRWSYDVEMSEVLLHNLFEIIYSQSLTQHENIVITPLNSDKSNENLIYETKISDIQILNRQKSGLVTKILITTPNFEINISTQYTIRQILGSFGGKVIRNDATEYTLNNMLPSAYFYIDNTTKDGDVMKISVHGAGFGHGCGLSQNGAKNLANMGLDYEQILKYYYNADINHLSLRSNTPSTP